MDCLDSPIISNDMIDHFDQSGSKNGRTPLMSYLQGSPTINKNLICSMYSNNKDKDDLDNTNLMYLCACSERFITDNGIDIFERDKGKQNKLGMTALMFLCNHSNIGISAVKSLEKELNKKDFNSYTALMYYLRLNHPRTYIVDMMRSEIGNTDYMGRTSLMHFFETEKTYFEPTAISIFHDLMKKEIGKKCFLGRTALMRYMHREKIQIEFVNMLSEEIGMQDYNGNTALLLYLTYNPTPSIRVVRCLSKEYEIPNNFGLTPSIFIKIKLERNENFKGKHSLIRVMREFSKKEE